MRQDDMIRNTQSSRHRTCPESLGAHRWCGFSSSCHHCHCLQGFSVTAGSSSLHSWTCFFVLSGTGSLVWRQCLFRKTYFIFWRALLHGSRGTEFLSFFLCVKNVLICYVPGTTFDSSWLPLSSFRYGFSLDLSLWTVCLVPSFLNKLGT